MRVSHMRWCATSGWTGEPLDNAGLLLVFGGDGQADVLAALSDLRRLHPQARLVGCSTAGEIHDVEVSDDTLSTLAVAFEATSIEVCSVRVQDFDDSVGAGEGLAQLLCRDNLRHVLVFSDGLGVNGSELARGLKDALPAGVLVTGGLAGDADKFERTQIFVDDVVDTGVIACVGFYGDAIVTACGSLGGWDVFGPDRVVTRSEGNVLYQLDGESALSLYQRYLGDYAQELPGSGLLFPLNIQTSDKNERVVRTILGVDEANQSLTFAGDVPEGARAQLMRANFDRLVDGATGAASICETQRRADFSWEFALLISCVGRRMVLQQRVEEEVEGVRDVLGRDTPLVGFYSYGELAPFAKGDSCRLHNQTMTITTFAERVNA